MLFLTLGQLKRSAHARRVLVAAEYHPELRLSPISIDKSEHKWSGISTTSVSELNAYISARHEVPADQGHAVVAFRHQLSCRGRSGEHRDVS